ncbi:MAG: DUF4136 domain-containing protein [Pseudomonadota bacterium]
MTPTSPSTTPSAPPLGRPRPLGRAPALAALALMTLGLAGCAGMNTLTSEVSSYGTWPADRKPGLYAFERLPSQQARSDQQQRLEAAARPALEAVGFKPASDPKSAEFNVQLSARSSANERSRSDPFFAWQAVPRPYGVPGRPYYPGHGHGYGPGYGPGLWVVPMDLPSYEREVVVLIRDAKQGQTLFESHAVNDGTSPTFRGLLGAMFEAALKDFPQAGPGPRNVTTALPP